MVLLSSLNARTDHDVRSNKLRHKSRRHQTLYQAASLNWDTVQDVVLLKNRKFRQIGSNLVSTCSFCPNKENEYLQLMFLTINNEVIGSEKWPNHASCSTSPDVNEPYAHRRCASDERVIFSTITRCYDKRVTVFAVAIVAGDMEVLYGKFK